MYIDVIINDKVETLNLYSLPDYNEDRSIAYIYNGFFNLGEDKICYLIYEVPIYVDDLNITHYDWENKKSTCSSYLFELMKFKIEKDFF